MAKVALEGMEFYAYHGFYAEEQLIGHRYIIDVYVETNISVAAATDDLYKTVNYETIYLVCKVEMRKTTKLIETVAQRILSRLGSQFGKKAQNITVRIRKLHPALGGKVACSFIEVDNKKLGLKGGGKVGGGMADMFGGGGDDLDDFDDLGDFDLDDMRGLLP